MDISRRLNITNATLHEYPLSFIGQAIPPTIKFLLINNLRLKLIHLLQAMSLHQEYVRYLLLRGHLCLLSQLARLDVEVVDLLE